MHRNVPLVLFRVKGLHFSGIEKTGRIPLYPFADGFVAGQNKLSDRFDQFAKFRIEFLNKLRYTFWIIDYRLP